MNFNDIDLAFLFRTGYNNQAHWNRHHKRVSATINLGNSNEKN